jgi:hypothetical protein
MHLFLITNSEVDLRKRSPQILGEKFPVRRLVSGIGFRGI